MGWRRRLDWARRQRVRQAQAEHHHPPSISDAGLTLVECLVSLTTVALAGALVGPPLLLASATQLQAQRVQQAQHLAQAEIDQVRAVVRRSTGQTPPNLTLPPISAAATLEQQPPPQAIAAIRSIHPHCRADERAARANEAIGVDIDIDIDSSAGGTSDDAPCTAEFLVQAFRTGSPADAPQAAPFEMMVRVYAMPREGFEHLQTEVAPVRLGQAMTRRPLAVVTATLTPSDTPAVLLCYHDQGCGE